jgi:uncharacterized protein
MTEHGHFHWNELATRDVERAKKFYADTLGWSFESIPMPEGSYWIASAGGEPVAGIVEGGSDAPSDGWMSYIAVDDVDARVKKAVQAGAKVLQSAFDVPDVGRIVILAEPGGAAIGWMTPAAE